ncbi:MAG TPA: U32 family peptidase [Bacillota bacterium]|nr:U32 family peptidase [Bacillota bacterium]
MVRPELLIPAGNLEKLRTAVLYGADAVYVGIEGLSLRAAQAEFSLADLEQGIREAHRAGVKVYGAINTFARNSDLPKIAAAVERLAILGIDAVIVSDPGVVQLIRKINPKLPLHLSTQANTTNQEAVRFWKTQGVSRVVLARELTLAEIAEVAAAVPEVEVELFIHGAMCVAYSGRCFLSAHRNRRSANRGDCTQPCRWEYAIHESTRPNDPILMETDSHYTYLLNSKDLCMIAYLPEVLRAGVTSLKVEGRMKSAYYVALVTRTYRQAIDAYLRDPGNYRCQPEWLAELEKTSHRGYTTGFYFSSEMIRETTPERKYTKTHDLVGTVLEYHPATQQMLVGVRNRLAVGDEVDLLLPDGILPVDLTQMNDVDGIPVQIAHNSYQVSLPAPAPVPVGAVLRRKMVD